MINKEAWVEKSRLGGLRRNELYGNLGTSKGRSKGGRKTVRYFQQNPKLAEKASFIIRKKIHLPKKSRHLSELFGIILGDGGLSGNHQLTISFNRETDKEYSLYLKNILRKLFLVDCNIHFRKNNLGADIVVSSSNLINFLLKHGLVVGNKVRNQVDIPGWINRKKDYQKACLRGLIDTDGSFYHHKYYCNGKKYNYLKLCFASRSKPLLNSVWRILKEFNFNAYMHGDQVFINSRLGIKKYFEEIGSNNPKHSNKIRKFLAN